ncbi:MAG: MarC family protein [Planctomycetota bacterium]|jgi:multiple antibiotic resistance protein
MPLLEEIRNELVLVVKAVLALYIVVNPSGVSSVFLGLTKGVSTAQRRGIAFRAAIAGGVILVLFALAGTYIFRIFRITAASLQIAGGIFVFGVAFALARGKESEFFGKLAQEDLERAPKSVAYYPLAMPLIAGPASITVVMTLSADAASLFAKWTLLAPIGIVAFLCLLSMWRVLRLEERLGPGLSLILPRIMGLVLAIIAVQFIISGVVQVLPTFAAALREAAPK